MQPIAWLRAMLSCRGIIRSLGPTAIPSLHRQGFYALDEVEECILEPGGTFAIKRKEPPPSELHYAEVIQRLDALDGKLSRIVNGPSNS